MSESKQSELANDSVQFPRLLAAISEIGMSETQFAAMCDTAELSPEEVKAVFRRAVQVWEHHKALAAIDEDRDRGWVFTNEKGEQLAYATPDEYRTADDAYRGFSKIVTEPFEIWFRDSNGVRQSTADTSRAEDFE